ncbi:hypothetical protein [Streptomyces sp. NPDC014894]|uniref:hypothetical protein n=1 Tax=unclassified Streptomyces TaxID=2593676 RepID=UPI003701FD49
MSQEKEDKKGDPSEIDVLKKSWDTFYENMVKKEYFKQFEISGVKTESNAAVAAANVFNAEVTGIKLEHTFWDPIAKREERRLQRGEMLPEQLRRSIIGLDADIVKIRGTATTDRTAHATDVEAIGTRIGNLSEEIEGKLRLKADKSAVQSANSTQNRDIGDLSEGAHRASLAMQALEERLRSVESQI